MKNSKIIFPLVVYLLVLALLAIPEAFVQYHKGLQQWGMVLITNRMAMIAHLLFMGLLFLFVLPLFFFFQDTRLLKSCLVSVGAVMLTVFFVELCIRVSGIAMVYAEKRNGFYLSMYSQPIDGSPYHVHIPNSDVPLRSMEFNYLRRTNSLGISFPDIPHEKQPDEIRIMALGDSFTEGDGAPADSTWMKTLERRVKPVYPAAHLTFINAGVCGSDPVFEYRLFKDKLLAYHPDFVLVATNLSDVDDILLRGGFERFIGTDSCTFRKGPWWENIYAFSHLFRLVVQINHNQVLLTPEEDRVLRQQAIQVIRESFLRFDTLTAAHEAWFVAVFMPNAVDVQEGIFGTLGPLADILLQHDSIEGINLLPYYTGKGGMTRDNVFDYYWKIDGHHTSSGYEVFGNAVADYFLENNLIDKALIARQASLSNDTLQTAGK